MALNRKYSIFYIFKQQDMFGISVQLNTQHLQNAISLFGESTVFLLKSLKLCNFYIVYNFANLCILRNGHRQISKSPDLRNQYLTKIVSVSAYPLSINALQPWPPRARLGSGAIFGCWPFELLVFRYKGAEDTYPMSEGYC